MMVLYEISGVQAGKIFAQSQVVTAAEAAAMAVL